MWMELEAMIRNYLEGITLEDLIEHRIPRAK